MGYGKHKRGVLRINDADSTSPRVETLYSTKSLNKSAMFEDSGDPKNIYLRNYETSKDRCERIYRQNQSNLLE